MHKGYNATLIKDNDRVVGVSLGSNFCAEHEMGIKDIRHFFGLDGSKPGIEGRRINNVPERFGWVDSIPVPYQGGNIKASGFAICVKPYLFDSKKEKILQGAVQLAIKCDGWNASDEDIFAAWSSHDFCVVSHVSNYIVHLREIYEAIANHRAVIWCGGAGAFANPGLSFGIISRFPDDIKEEWYYNDININKIKEEFYKQVIITGYKYKLEERFKLEMGKFGAGRYLFALTPKFYNKKDGLKMWINDGQSCHGWVTVKDIEDYLNNNSGKIREKLDSN